jgi:hypothetical protein
MTTATVSQPAHQRPALVFLHHLGEMTAAMFAGMFALGLALGFAASGAGSNLESIRASDPELFMLGMGSAMSLTMVAWMRRRGHSPRAGWEMTAAMFAPVLVCARLLLGGRDNRRSDRSALLHADDPGDGGRDVVPARRLHDARPRGSYELRRSSWGAQTRISRCGFVFVEESAEEIAPPEVGGVGDRRGWGTVLRRYPALAGRAPGVDGAD